MMAKQGNERADEVLKPDLCVIGAGSAGLSVASIGASLGVSVVLIEKSAMGGECLNVGCVPSKALIAAGNRRQSLREAARFGIVQNGEASVDFARVRSHVKDVIAEIAPMDSAERYGAMGVKVIREAAAFVDASTVKAGRHAIKARSFVLATGSKPAIPPIPGLDGIAYLTNDDIFDLGEKPDHLVILGGGPIGVEIGQAYRRLGCRVTLIEAGPRILPHEDPEMAGVIERALRDDGVAIKTGIQAARAEPGAVAGFVLHLTGEGQTGTLQGSHLLLAAGRRAVTEGLGLEAAGIKTDQSGIVVDKGLRTTNSRVYAIGDCAGGAARGGRFTHVANQQAGLVIRNALFHLPIRTSDTAIPHVTYTDPELATVGLSEEDAREKHGAIRVLRWPFAENDRARAERATTGHVKAIVTARGRILGCAIAGPHAGELIVPWVLAIAKDMKVSDLAGIVMPYPTLSEATKRAAVEFLKPLARKPWMRRAIHLARLFG
jgi:pyruvate/2-oxoglutarate dehydrogenase complex dihydrolipoamide dehydrogenase (E3) component